MLADKDSLNKVLTETIEQQKTKVSEADALKQELDQCKNSLDEAIKEKEQLQLKHEKDVLELQKQLQNEKIEEIAKYQEMYMTLLQNQQQEQTKKTTRKPRKATTKGE